MTARHQRPPCGHAKLVDCGLSVDDWNTVFLAYLGFLQTCRLVGEQAHARHNTRAISRPSEGASVSQFAASAEDAS